MRLALVLVIVLVATISTSGQQAQLMENFSGRSVAVTIAMIGVAQQRGAESVDVNDLLMALIIEDHDPNAPVLFQDASPNLLIPGGMHLADRQHQPFLSSKIAVDILVKGNQVLPRGTPVTKGLPMSPALMRVLAAAQKLPAQYNQTMVALKFGSQNRKPGMYQAVVPLDLFAAALQEPCEITKMLQEAGITEETVLQVIRAGGDLEKGGSS
jgi:hypothetical protein